MNGDERRDVARRFDLGTFVVSSQHVRTPTFHVPRLTHASSVVKIDLQFLSLEACRPPLAVK